ncbi:hypothetical protein RIF29_34883 [Crotalaria pallida]|uniref:Uncharacterized protein n=1 Tax=Crotalaria pallida TaxID=3830 RepID=A0AAN9HTJ4_CROPI
MAQRKGPSKLVIQGDHVLSDKCLENLELSYYENKDGKSIGTDMKKQRKKPMSIKLSDLETLQSPPFHVPTTAPSQQKQKKPLARPTDGSPNYLKPTRCSDAKKEVFVASLRNTQSVSSDGKKASFVCSKKPAKTLTSSSSLNMMRTSTKPPSFKTSSACPRKSTTEVKCADVNALERATCSSTLKESKFPSYLMLNPGGTESDGASVMKVCSYKYCSLNGHHQQSSFPPLKSFISVRRRLLKIKKSMKLEAPSPQISKVSCETKKDNGIEQENVFDGEPAYDEADMVSPIFNTLAKEIDMDFFIEIHVKENEGDIEDQEEMKFAIEENGLAVEEDNVKQVTPSMTHAVPASEIDHEEDFKNCFDDVTIEEDNEGSFYQEQNAKDADEIHQPNWFHEEVSIGSYSSEVSNDEENKENIELDVSDSHYTDLEWKEEQYCASSHEEDIYSSVSAEETDSKSESFLESSHDVSAMWLDDMVSRSHNAGILFEKASQETNEGKSTSSETEPHSTDSFLEDTSESIEAQETDYSSNEISYDHCPSTEEIFQHLSDAGDNNRENEVHECDKFSCCATKILDEEMVEKSEGQKLIESYKIDESRKEKCDESISQEKQSLISVQGLQSLEGDQVKINKFESTSFICDEKEAASKNWQWASRHRRPVQDDDEEMRKINPRKPNFLPLVPDQEPEKTSCHKTSSSWEKEGGIAD